MTERDNYETLRQLFLEFKDVSAEFYRVNLELLKSDSPHLFTLMRLEDKLLDFRKSLRNRLEEAWGIDR